MLGTRPQIPIDAPDGLRPDRDMPRPAPLTDHAKQPHVEVDVLQGQAEYLTASSAGVDQYLKDGGAAATGERLVPLTDFEQSTEVPLSKDGRGFLG